MRRARRLLDLPFCAVLAACGSNSTSALSPPAVDAAPPASPDWPAYGRDHDNSRANPAEHAITKSNVMTLEPRWAFSESAGDQHGVCVGRRRLFRRLEQRAPRRRCAKAARRSGRPLQPATAPNQAQRLTLRDGRRCLHRCARRALSAVDRKTRRPSLAAEKSTSKPRSCCGRRLSSSTICSSSVSARTRFSCRPRRLSRQRGGGGREIGHGEMASLPHGGSGVSIWSSAAIDKGRKLAFIGTGQEYSRGVSTPNSDALVAIRYETGELVWSQQFTDG